MSHGDPGTRLAAGEAPATCAAPAPTLVPKGPNDHSPALQRGERPKQPAPVPEGRLNADKPALDEVDLPELPRGWAWASVDHIISILQYGTSVKADADPGTGVPVLRMGNIKQGTLDYLDLKYVNPDKENIPKYLLQNGDILINRTNSAELVGKAGLFDRTNDYVFASYLIRLRVEPSLTLPRYLVLLINSEIGRRHIDKVKHQVAGQANINSQDIRALPVPLPPLPEQRRIVAEIEQQFSRLDASVAALQRVRANLKRYRAAVLRAACEGRLVPTEADLARAEGRDFEPADQLLRHMLAVRSDRSTSGQPTVTWESVSSQSLSRRTKSVDATITTDSPSSDLPEGWVWTRLGELKLFSLYGPRFSSDAYSPTGRLVLRTSDISPSGRVNLTTTPRISLGQQEFERYKVERGDLLVTRTGSLGTVAVYDDEVDAIPGAYLIQYRLRAALETSRYLLYFLKSPEGQSRLVAGGAGVGRPNLNAPTIEAIPIPLPPLAEQRRIVAEVERRLSIIDEIEAAVAANLKRAERLRQAILHRAFTGRLVPQDPNDEPASVLLERLRAEREAAGSNGARPRAPRRQAGRNVRQPELELG